MDVVELIKRDHDEMAELFDQLASIARDHRTVEAMHLAAQLVVAARVHARSEEHVLYEVLRTRGARLKAFALAGPHEHETLESTLDKLLIPRPRDDYQVVIRVARDLFEMHAREEEEAEILPLVCEALLPDERASLARDVAAERTRIRLQVLRTVGFPLSAA
jgi:hypothetical protein